MSPRTTKGSGEARARRGASAPADEGDRFRGLVEDFGEVVWEVDAELRYTYLSPNIALQIGYTAEEMLGRRPFETTIPERAAQMLSMAREMAARRQTFRAVRWMSRRKDGREVAIEMSGRPVYGPSGELAGFQGVSRDVTERVAQEKLKGALYEISDAASVARDLQDLFRRVHRILEGLMPAKNLYVALVDQEGSRIWFPYLVDEQDDPEPPEGRPLGRGLTEFVWRTGKTLLASPEEFSLLVESGEVELVGAWSVDWLGVPLKNRERTIGVLAVQSYEVGTRYTDDEARMLEFVSTQIASAIEHKEAEDSLRRASAEMKETILVLEQRSAELETLAEMGRHLQGASLAAEVGTLAGRYFGRLFPGTQGRLYRAPSQGRPMDVQASWGGGHSEPLARPQECWAVRLGRPYAWSLAGEDLRCGHLEKAFAAFSLCVPVGLTEGRPGLLSVEGDCLPGPAGEKGDARLNDLLALATTAAENAALALANLELRETLHEKAIRDPLTGLYNRRYLEEALDREIRRAARRGDSLGVLMVDLDDFKLYNDSLGHEAGDALLKALGRFLASHVRTEDIACRYGGEEFTILLPSAGEEQLLRRAEELRALGARVGETAPGVPSQVVTLSIGAALYPRHGRSPSALLRVADEAMYRAKAEGRDRVVLAAVPTPTPARGTGAPSSAR